MAARRLTIAGLVIGLLCAFGATGFAVGRFTRAGSRDASRAAGEPGSDGQAAFVAGRRRGLAAGMAAGEREGTVAGLRAGRAKGATVARATSAGPPGTPPTTAPPPSRRSPSPTPPTPPQTSPSATSPRPSPPVDSPQGRRLLQTNPDCQNAPPPPPSYHGPVQC